MAPYLGTISIPNPRGLAIAAPSYGGPSPCKQWRHMTDTRIVKQIIFINCESYNPYCDSRTGVKL